MASFRNACVRSPSAGRSTIRSLAALDPFDALRSDVGWLLDAFRGATPMDARPVLRATVQAIDASA